MDDDQQFCLRWNNHQSTLVSVFDTLLEKGIHVDCTLAAEGQTLKAHKVVLSACSPYFESVLSQQYDKHPIIILKDVKYAELRAMMDYMYRGEVNISQDQLAALLKAAESLQIKGLSDNKPSRPPSRPAQPTAHPPRALSPPPQVRDGSIDSREGSISPSRRRKKARRTSTESTPVPAPEPEDLPLKEEVSRDGVEDLTLDEEAEPSVTHNDVVRNFQWHMERSQDEMMNSNDSVRETQEVRKEALPSALLSLLSAQRAQAALVPRLLPLPDLPDPLKAHLLQQAFLQNNNTVAAAAKHDALDDRDSDPDPDYDDTDDIVLPEEGDAGEPGDAGGRRDDDASRQFECRHCGKRYRWKSTLRRHENVECGGKAPSHQCPYCSYRAKQRGNLGVHIRKHHNTEWYIYASNKARVPEGAEAGRTRPSRGWAGCRGSSGRRGWRCRWWRACAWRRRRCRPRPASPASRAPTAAACTSSSPRCATTRSGSAAKNHSSNAPTACTAPSRRCTSRATWSACTARCT